MGQLLRPDFSASELGDVRERYEKPHAYARSDSWHEHTAKQIRVALDRYWRDLEIPEDAIVLNAGAGLDDLDLRDGTSIHLDISLKSVANYENAVHASIEDIPLADGSIDVVVCIGSVLNYCDAARAIQELSRVLKPNGIGFLEFESSGSSEYFGAPCFRRSAAIAQTFYAGETETLWLYSLAHIKRLARAMDLEVAHAESIHVLSPFLLRIGFSQRVAALAGRLDQAAQRFPFLSAWASNYLLVLKKQGDV